MGLTAAIKLRQVGTNLETILALEVLCAAQGIDFRKKKIGAEKVLGFGTRDMYNQVRSAVPFIEKDEYLKDHIETVRSIVASFKN